MTLNPLSTRIARALLLPLLVVTACSFAGSAADDEGTNVSTSVGATEAPMGVAGGVAFAARSADALKEQAPGDALPSAPRQSATNSTIPSMIIRRGDVSIRVDTLEAAIDAVRRLAGSLGGYIGDVSMNAGEYEVRRATLVMRIPTARFDDAMAGMSPLGRVEHSSVSAEDVGEEFVDVQARITTGRRLESRLVELLATRTGKLEEVLQVERELARVRGEIERYEGRARYLSARVATSTIAVTVSERAPVVGSNPGRSVIGEAFVNAWRNFVGLVAKGIESLGVLVPLLLLAWGTVRLVRSRRRRVE
ncbi:MAG: DUF4349 domain-containing protein [Gemmatimonadales bacterium]|nr:DUF4349 domain-containing protein [Gemmatimonadales bacterium]